MSRRADLEPMDGSRDSTDSGESRGCAHTGESRGSTDSGDLPGRARCPFCGGRDTAPLATFGSLLMTSQYHCRRCRSTFERVRAEGD